MYKDDEDYKYAHAIYLWLFVIMFFCPKYNYKKCFMIYKSMKFVVQLARFEQSIGRITKRET